MEDQIEGRIKRIEKGKINDTLLYTLPSFVYDDRVPPAQQPRFFSVTALVGVAKSYKAAIGWIKPHDDRIDKFEVWLRLNVTGATPHIVASTADSPAVFTFQVDAVPITLVAHIITVMKNGLKTTLNSSPTIAFQAT